MSYPSLTQTRFIVLAQQRTGTNHLLSLLGSHPDVAAFGEVFSSPRQIQFGMGLAVHFRSQLPPPDEKTLLEAREADPVGFLKTHVFGTVTRAARAVGFKLFYDHCRTGREPEVWSWLEQQKEIAVIHLRRRNILRTLLSKRLANATGVWHQTSGETPPEPSAIPLQESDCREFFARSLLHERAADYRFRFHRVLPLWYEDLDERPDSASKAAQAFLGLPPQPSRSRLVKQAAGGLRARIENYDELKRAFASEHARVFFEE